MGLTLVIIGSVLQFVALAFTLSQIMGVLGIRRTLIRTIADAYQRLRGRRSATVHAVAARAYAHAGLSHAGVSIAGETDIDRLDRDVKDLRKQLAEMDDRIVDLGFRTKWALDDRLSELEVDMRKQAEKDATLAWWGIVLVGLGIVLQTVGSILQG